MTNIQKLGIESSEVCVAVLHVDENEKRRPGGPAFSGSVSGRRIRR